MIRLWPDANTCTMRPARIVAANQSAAWRTALIWRWALSISPRHWFTYSSAGGIAFSPLSPWERGGGEGMRLRWLRSERETVNKLDDIPKLGQQLIDLMIRADANAQSVALHAVIHVAHQDIAAFQLFKDRLHRSIRAARPDEIRVAGHDAEAQLRQFLFEALPGGEDFCPRRPEVLLVL